MKRNSLPPTRHLRGAIRRIDRVVRKLCDEQSAAYIAYVEAVCWNNKREAHKLFFAKLTEFGDRAVILEGKLTPKEKRHALRLMAYESEIGSLYNAARRLQSKMEATYLQQKKLRHGILDESVERNPKAASAH
jgi:hypothetical protein